MEKRSTGIIMTSSTTVCRFYRNRLSHLVLSLLFIVTALSENAFGKDITLAWDANRETNLAAYKLYYSVNASAQHICDQGASPITIPVTQLSTPNNPAFELTGLSPGYTYSFTITAINTMGKESGLSNKVTFFTPLDTGNDSTADSGNFLDSGASSGSLDNSGGGGEADFTSVFEADEIMVDHNWQQVRFENTYENPVVVAGEPSLNGSEPAIVRISRVSHTGFDICLQEWEYLDDQHVLESVGYIVMESGAHTLPDGKIVSAGTFSTNKTKSFEQIYFEQPFDTPPIVCASANTFNAADAITIRIRNITTQGFQLMLQEQEANARSHDTETISYIAWEKGQGEFREITYEIDETASVVYHSDYKILLKQYFSRVPILISAMQTYNGGDTASIRWQEKTTDSVKVRVMEEQSQDDETYHTTESVGYMLFQVSN